MSHLRTLGLFYVAALAAGCGAPRVSDLDAGPAPEVAPSVASTSTPSPQSTPAAVCSGAPHPVIVWGLRNWQALGASFAAENDPCGEYFISIPPVDCDPAGKICPRGPLAPEKLRALAPNVHAVAEFHWASWSKWVAADPSRSWYGAGVEFRSRMDSYGYDVAAGDTWAINEFPSTVRTGAGSARGNARDAVRGLRDGGAARSKGIIFEYNMGHDTTNLSLYKPTWESFLQDAPFWSEMDTNVRFFAQEVYVDPKRVCVPNATVAARSNHVNQFTEHPARLAFAGGASVARARMFFDHAYVPLMNASADNTVFQTDTLAAGQMKQFVSLQVYAARAWSASHAVPDARIGFAWAPAAGADPVTSAAIGDRLAQSITGAYQPGGTASRACSATANLAGCACSVSGSAFSESWAAFGSF